MPQGAGPGKTVVVPLGLQQPIDVPGMVSLVNQGRAHCSALSHVNTKGPLLLSIAIRW
jgi:hypothetical protein